MSSSERFFSRFGVWVFLKCFVLGVGLLLAFPIKWCWNYSVVPTFSAPPLDWGMAWCLFFLIAQTKMTVLYCEHKGGEHKDTE